MAWTTPATWSNGVVVSATDLNAQVRDNLRYLKGLDGVPYIETAVELPEMATPATPASGRGRLFVATDGVAKSVDDAGTLRQMLFWEKATYTPTYIGLTSAGSTTYSVQQGWYRRLDDLVTFAAYLHWTASTASGLAAVTLPFAAANVANQRSAVSVWSFEHTYGGDGLQGLILPGEQQVRLYTAVSGGGTDLPIDSAGRVLVAGSYLV